MRLVLGLSSNDRDKQHCRTQLQPRVYWGWMHSMLGGLDCKALGSSLHATGLWPNIKASMYGKVQERDETVKEPATHAPPGQRLWPVKEKQPGPTETNSTTGSTSETRERLARRRRYAGPTTQIVLSTGAPCQKRGTPSPKQAGKRTHVHTKKIVKHAPSRQNTHSRRQYTSSEWTAARTLRNEPACVTQEAKYKASEHPLSRLLCCTQLHS
jgi:hypothetical protein